jgi:uncharacterized pyridoxal phosphate-containing UPF0001 family protein
MNKEILKMEVKKAARTAVKNASSDEKNRVSALRAEYNEKYVKLQTDFKVRGLMTFHEYNNKLDELKAWYKQKRSAIKA